MNRTAFSLVELSIVLVILGLLTGGILTGQNLIRAAELRSITTDLKNYQTAAMTFRDKYFYLPGDMPNATDFWGAATCPTAAGSGAETCNGDGDGQIETPVNASEFGEMFTFWQHLANAGMIEGSYTGIAGSDAKGDTELGENAPSSKLSSIGWDALYENNGGSATVYKLNYGNRFQLGVDQPTGTTSAVALLIEEVWNIDTKIDDGKPGQGKVISRHWDTCTDSTSFSDYDGNYLLSDSSTKCAIFFRNAF